MNNKYMIASLLAMSCGMNSMIVSADSCSGSQPGWPVFNNGNNVHGYPEICGWQYTSGNMSIGGDKTHSWSTNGSYKFIDGCAYRDTTSITVATTGSGTTSPWSATATNWLTADGSSHTRHWSTGALYSNGSIAGVGQYIPAEFISDMTTVSSPWQSHEGNP